ncbi:MAG: hypothetical protein LYZ69_01355 [Nitrososphaerales archaeon]|nr:hypothetical protein [Nitrososphaerales archaeon]
MRFFNVSLINANVMSSPRYPEPQRFVGELIHSIEAASPRFAWVQLLFRRANYSPSLVALKNDINLAAVHIKTPKTSIIDDSEYDRPELHRDWFKKSAERIKRIDAIVNSPQVLLAIQGMWVGDPGDISSLPFKDCHDELDRLGTFVYRNPWMLVDLVERRMVEDVSPYFMSYTRSRLEPPSFLITKDELPYFVHLPIVKEASSMKSVAFSQYSPVVPGGDVEGAGEPEGRGVSKVLRLTRVPLIKEPLKEKDAERLSLLASPAVRSLEVVFTSGKTDVLISSGSVPGLNEYLAVLKSVYGELGAQSIEPNPAFLTELPGIVGLEAAPVKGRA